MNSSAKIRNLTRIAILVAVIFLLSFIRPLKLTLVQIPVIVGATLLGRVAGVVLGFFFGLSEYIQALEGAQILTTTALNMDHVLFVFVCFVPRILTGWITALLAAKFKRNSEKRKNTAKKSDGRVLHHSLTGFFGSLLNTILYLGFLYLLFRDALAQTNTTDGGTLVFILVLFFVFGIPEAIISAVVVPAVCRAMEVIFRRLPAPKH